MRQRLIVVFFVSLSGCTQGPILFEISSDIDIEEDEHIRIGEITDRVCEGQTPYVMVPTENEYSICSGQLAERLFRFALCTCENATILGGLYTDSFDSANTTYTDVDDVGGAVGVNEKLSVFGTVMIGGTLITTGKEDLNLAYETAVLGDFQVAGSLVSEKQLKVSRDLLISGDLLNKAGVETGRNLQLSGEIAQLSSVTIGGSIVKNTVHIAHPCSCDPGEILDIPAITTKASQDNHNSDIGLDPSDLEFITSYVDVTLHCGRYYLNNIKGYGKLTLYIKGPVALFISGDFDLAGDLDIVFEENSSLDVFIAGNLELTGISDYWDITRPSKLRFYVNGTEDILLRNLTGFNLYAPRARAIIDRSFALGSIFTKSFLATQSIRIHYDRDVLRETERCGDSAIAELLCDLSGDDCTVDADCCAPFVCDRQACQPFGTVI